MDEYLNQIRNIANQLSFASTTVEDEDLVLLTLNGLPDECEALKTTIRARVEAITMEDLSSLLYSEAIYVENKTKHAFINDLPMACAVTKGSESGSFISSV
ncbi:hypothetical protein CsSME_00053589 [Camellia sinensis var. sinensis]